MAVTPDLNQIAVVMSQLQHNYSQLAQNWFNIFYNTEPQDVTITFFDELGNYETYTVPNRAKDFTYILNGEGSPESSVTAEVGSVYQDLTNGEAYLKKTGTGNIGWVKFISASDLENIIRKGTTNPEGNITGSVGDLYVDSTLGIVYVKTTATGNTGWTQISSNLPTQTGQSGKYLTTNGTYASWETVDALPTQTGQANKFLKTNGTVASWSTINALPDQTGESGKYLTTDGTDASWAQLTTYHPTLFSHQWSDCLKYDVQWLRADDYSWNSGALYEAAFEHLLTDVYNVTKYISDGTNNYSRESGSDVSGATAAYAWKYSSTTVYTIYEKPSVNDTAYTTSAGETSAFTITNTGRTLVAKVSPTTETIGSYSVVYYRATDGHKICLANQATVVKDIYDATGIAWYYVLDTTNDQFKLPRTKYGFEGLRTNVGDKIDESLPNITGSVTSQRDVGYLSSSGSLTLSNNVSGDLASNTGYWTNHTLNFDASNSSSTYQNNAPVQERATQMYLYFYVGSYTQTAIEQTAGVTTETLSHKMDLDLGNITSSSKSTIMGWGNYTHSELNINFGTTSLSTYLPDNTGQYLVLLYGECYDGGSSKLVERVSSDIMTYPMAYLGVAEYDDYWYGNIWIPVSANGSINITGNNIADTRKILGYRKI